MERKIKKFEKAEKQKSNNDMIQKKIDPNENSDV